MPTTIDEATRIVSIIDDYLKPDLAKKVIGRLHKEVGSTTSNESLKASLLMLNNLYNHDDFPLLRFKLSLAKKFIYLLVTFHLLVIFGNCFAAVVYPFIVHWSVSLLALPIFMVCINLMFSRYTCMLTELENKLRVLSGKPQIKAFIKHYILRIESYK